MANTRPCRTFHSHLVNSTFQPFIIRCFAFAINLSALPPPRRRLPWREANLLLLLLWKFFAKAECENVAWVRCRWICVPTTMVSLGVCLSVSLSSRLRLWHTLRMSNASNFNAISMRWCVCCCCYSVFRGYLQVCVGLRMYCLCVCLTVVVFKCMPICMAFVNTFYLLTLFLSTFYQCFTLFIAHLWHLVCCCFGYCTHIVVAVPAVVVLLSLLHEKVLERSTDLIRYTHTHTHTEKTRHTQSASANGNNESFLPALNKKTRDTNCLSQCLIYNTKYIYLISEC